MNDIKSIKKQIRMLKNIKKDIRVGTSERNELNKKLREHKKELETFYNKVTPEKQTLMDKIYNLEPNLKRVNVDLRNFTTEQLQFHYNKITKKESKNEETI